MSRKNTAIHGKFSGDYFIHLALLIDNVALARRLKSTVVYTINGSVVRAFPNESVVHEMHEENRHRLYVYIRTFSYINMQYASSMEPLHYLHKEAFIWLWMRARGFFIAKNIQII